MKTKTNGQPLISLEALYNFCGQLDSTLKYDYRKQKLKSKGVTYPQFCIVVFANLTEEAKNVLTITPYDESKNLS
ncbi:MAG: hypothetical protein FJY17_00655 [Bacteroidetes bacterium]|nr:hypothetical protein [Bacteroidota bacterium]